MSTSSGRAIERHRAFLEEGGGLAERRRRNLGREVFAVASARAKRHLERSVADDQELKRLLDAVGSRELDPLTAYGRTTVIVTAAPARSCSCACAARSMSATPSA